MSKLERQLKMAREKSDHPKRYLFKSVVIAIIFLGVLIVAFFSAIYWFTQFIKFAIGA